MANYEATKYDYTGANLTGIEGVNTGIIVPWGTASAPTGFLECAGAAVSRTTYATLFALVGTTYGVGDGSTTFNVPSLADKCCVSTSPTKAIASTGGANTVAASGNVAGSASSALATPEIPSHTHSYNTGGCAGSPSASFDASEITSPAVGGGGVHTHPSSLTFTGSASSVLQPYLTMIYIIKT